MATRAAIARLAAAVTEAFLPSLCAACRLSQGPDVCAACRARIVLLRDPCPRCGSPRSASDARCDRCRGRGLPWIAAAHVSFAYAGLIDELVGEAKAGGRAAAVGALCSLFPEIALDVDCVVPVPPASGRRPGPHLATALARTFARRIGRPLRRALKQTRMLAEQHRLTYAERRRNLAGAFAARPIAGRVALVDDLMTSGATAVAAAAALRQAGAERVELVCLARTPRRRIAGTAVDQSN
jgi:predicted amidophosphoribosyltransferase